MSSKRHAFLHVMNEYDHAIEKHGTFKNPHEALGVIHEELYEVMQAIHANDDTETYKELTQLAAVCCKGLTMLQEKYNKDMTEDKPLEVSIDLNTSDVDDFISAIQQAVNNHHNIKCDAAKKAAESPSEGW